MAVRRPTRGTARSRRLAPDLAIERTRPCEMTKGNERFCACGQHIGIAYARPLRSPSAVRGSSLGCASCRAHGKLGSTACSRSPCSPRWSRGAVGAATRRVTSSPAPTRSAQARYVRPARSRRRRPRRSRAARWPFTWAQVVPLVQSEADQLAGAQTAPRQCSRPRHADRLLHGAGGGWSRPTASSRRRPRRGDAQTVADVEATLRASPVAELAASYGLRTCGTPGSTSA